MNNQFEIVSPGPWDDPEFAPHSWNGPRAKSESRRSRRIGATGLSMTAIWLVVLLDPMVRLLILGGLMAMALTPGVLVAAMALGMIGTGLFAVGDRFIAWLRRNSRWPEE